MIQALRRIPDCELHLVISQAGLKNFQLETNIDIESIKQSVDFYYENNNLAAAISSGSFATDGMIVIPCSMKTLSAIATGYAESLLVRAADVCLKENRKVILVPREMPLGKIHLHNMKTAAEMGCTIIPPMLTFYNNLPSVEEQIDHIIGKILMQFGIRHDCFLPWQGCRHA
jgi:4-hydroxy-3-polyprenylbenzoate decarboxylase